MAWTVSMVNQIVHGSNRGKALRVTTDSAEQNITTGFNVVDFFMVGNVLCTDAAYAIYANSGTTGTAIGGNLGCSGFGTGDIFFITVFGH